MISSVFMIANSHLLLIQVDFPKNTFMVSYNWANNPLIGSIRELGYYYFICSFLLTLCFNFLRTLGTRYIHQL